MTAMLRLAGRTAYRAGRSLRRGCRSAADASAPARLSASQRQRPCDSSSKRGEIVAMRGKLVGAGSSTLIGQSRPPRPGPIPATSSPSMPRRRRPQIDRQRFLPARHREPDLGQELRVEQRAVQRAMRVVDRRSARTARRGCCACRETFRARGRACRSSFAYTPRTPGARRARARRRGTRRRTARCG